MDITAATDAYYLDTNEEIQWVNNAVTRQWSEKYESNKVALFRDINNKIESDARVIKWYGPTRSSVRFQYKT